ncbi:MAG TPA: universal stress protein [Thermomicrobiaceae bacterium]|nr:universal stress protein [Thermomicrobiaceae bacterium]
MRKDVALYRRLLVPVNGDRTDFPAIDLAAHISAGSGPSELTLIYVVEVPQQFSLDTELPEVIRSGEEIIARAEEHADDKEPDTWNRVNSALLQARFAAAAIVDEAIERGSDLIVLGIANQLVHGVLTQGKTLPYVLQNAPCDVIVLRRATEGEFE